MQLPVDLALAQPAPEIPVDGNGQRWSLEPKLDGWRGCLASAQAVLHSRSGTNLTARFPELLAPARSIGRGDAVFDGELVAFRDGRLEFAALQAGPNRRRNAGATVFFMVFDVLYHDGHDLRSQPYQQRRALLVDLVPPRGLVQLVPATTSRTQAANWMQEDFGAVGIEGVVAKPLNAIYSAGRRSGWRKIRQRYTTEAAVLGITTRPIAVVLGRPSRSGRWRAVGLSLPLGRDLARNLLALLRVSGPAVRLPGVIAGLPGSDDVVCLPVQPEVVIEISADQAIEFGRFRHRPKGIRIRADLTPSDLRLRDTEPLARLR